MHWRDRNAARNRLRGAAGFDAYYRQCYGERWDALRRALLAPSAPVSYDAGGAQPYVLDVASIRAAATLPLAGAGRLLDLCAAPGGKTIVLASRMDADATLVANDRSPSRVKRLACSCASCLPPAVSARVSVRCSDGARWGRMAAEQYDRILLDAPCSSERHVLSDARHLAQWSPARVKAVTTMQWALLSAAFRLLAPNGFLLYATCAVLPQENDDMIARLLTRFPDACCVEPPEPSVPVSACIPMLPAAAHTAHGRIIMPDEQSAGPLYYSLIAKRAVGLHP
ncbi:MAG: RsmB/NOP family class I SAM-dependent RNA methyltransferase [Treponema sp.]|nr:RsmB/NOP family class I SAM-dependent RNA methyltransferase [Treponema sp.]